MRRFPNVLRDAAWKMPIICIWHVTSHDSTWKPQCPSTVPAPWQRPTCQAAKGTKEISPDLLRVSYVQAALPGRCRPCRASTCCGRSSARTPRPHAKGGIAIGRIRRVRGGPKGRPSPPHAACSLIKGADRAWRSRADGCRRGRRRGPGSKTYYLPKRAIWHYNQRA